MWEAITQATLTVEGLEPAHTSNISQRASATNPAELAQALPHARTAKAFDKTKLKLIRVAQLSGSKHMNGTAPRGGIERDAQHLLEELGEMAMDV